MKYKFLKATIASLHTVWAGVDNSATGTPVNFAVNWAQTAFLVKGLKIHISTDATSDWEEIDAVQLSGFTATVPEPSTLAIFALGMIGLASRRFNK